MILVLVKGNLERVKDEPYGRLFQSVKRHQLVLELFSKDFFGGKKEVHPFRFGVHVRR